MTAAQHDPRARARLFGKAGRVIALVALAIALLFAAAVAGALALRGMITRSNRDIGLIVAKNGVQQAGYVVIGGVRQWVTARGQDRNAPVLIYLHGGPGGATSDLAYAFQRPWEDYFIVVQWDQRGAGRSGVDGDKLKGTMTHDRLVADTVEVIEWARRHFGKRKVVLMGQSNGTTFGLEVARRRPELLFAYVGVGQQIGWDAWYYEETRRLVMAEARQNGDAAQVRRLEAIGPPRRFATAHDFNEWTFAVQREMHLNGHGWWNAKGHPNWEPRAIGIALASPDIDNWTLVRGYPGAIDGDTTFEMLDATTKGWSAEGTIGTRFNVPMIFLHGHHDWQTPVTFARRYYEKLCAPWKLWVEFPNSAHIVHMEEPGRFVVALVTDVLPAARGETPPGAERCAAAGAPAR